MGQALIDSGGENGLYDITIVKDAGRSSSDLAQINARLVTLTVEISTAQATLAAEISELGAAQAALNAAIADMDGTADKRKAVTDAQGAVLSKQADVTQARAVLARLVASQSSLNSRKSIIESAMVAESRAGVWCADLTENLAVGATVGTAEINGEDNQIIILPGGSTTNALGKLQHSGISTGAGVFVNKALLPCWQKWKPTYRIGTVIDVDFEENTCTVGIAEQYSGEQGLTINQSGVVWDETSDSVPGFDDFADRYPSFPLVTNTGDTKLTMTPALMADMAAVQADVQNRFKYRTDAEQFNTLENWDFMQEGGSGDCEDHCLTKAKKLLDLGYPASAIKIEVGNMPDGTGHAWLVVQTDKGDYALDNNYQNVIKASSLPYSNRRRQTGTTWGSRGVKLSDVPIEYMDGVDSSVFVAGDRVVVAFEGQDWTKPKVIGFESNPRGGHEIYATYQSGTWIRSVGAYTINGVFKYNLDITILPANYSTFINVVLSSFSDGPFVFAQSLDYLAQGPKMKCEFWQNEAKTVKTYSFWQDAIASFYASKSVSQSDVFVTLGGSLLVGDNLYVTFFTICEGFIRRWLNGIVCFSKTTGLLLGMRTFAYSLGPFANYGPSPSICVNGGYIYTPDQSYDGTQGIIRITPISFEAATSVNLGSGRSIAMAACAGDDRFYGVYYNVAVPSGAQSLYLDVFEHGATSAKHTVNLPLRQYMIWAGSPQVKMVIYKGKLVIWFRTTWNDTGADEYRRFTCDPLTGAIEKNETGTFSNNTSEITIVES